MTRLGNQEPHTSRKSRKVGFYERPCICGHEYGAHAGAENRCTFRVIVGQVQTEVDDAETEERTCNLCPPCGFTETGGSYPGMWPAVARVQGSTTFVLEAEGRCVRVQSSAALTAEEYAAAITEQTHGALRGYVTEDGAVTYARAHPDGISIIAVSANSGDVTHGC